MLVLLNRKSRDRHAMPGSHEYPERQIVTTKSFIFIEWRMIFVLVRKKEWFLTGTNGNEIILKKLHNLVMNRNFHLPMIRQNAAV